LLHGLGERADELALRLRRMFGASDGDIAGNPALVERRKVGL
jgi:hypothetical protein